jgi:hypothetical protein
VKLCRVPARDITAMAKARLFEDAEYRSRLIEEAKQVVEQWRVEGFFGKRAEAERRGYPSRCIPTCSDIQLDTSSPTMATMRDRSRITSDTEACNRLRGTRHWPKEGSRSSGRTSRAVGTNFTNLKW